MQDFLFHGNLDDLDSDVFALSTLEEERQVRKLILIPSESQAPLAIREVLGSAFQNIYAEGYPDDESRWMSEAEIMDFDTRLAEYRRYSDPRYYKGVEYADLVEALARRRTAEAFATRSVSADQIWVNVQALSGAPANNAVYSALLEPGDTIMGMALTDGGHLSHGARVNRSGKLYRSVPYSVDLQTEKLNYDMIENLARENRPKIIIAGYSSYPWMVDWERFRKIADSVGAYLLADIAHVAGLVAGGVYPSPIGWADVVTFTTHKSMCGPRGACILTLNSSLAKKIDRAVFPGEQGGPHVNSIAAIAVAMKLAKTEKFRSLQEQVVKNCSALTKRLEENGFRIPFGGTNTHLTNVDCSSVVGADGCTLSGDQAARILDIAGIVVNRNTIPGDKSAVDPSGIRLGTPWITQRGLKEGEMFLLADVIADLLKSAHPYYLSGRSKDVRRAKFDFKILEASKIKVRDLAAKAGMASTPEHHSYPHFYYLDDEYQGDWVVFELSGEKIRQFLNYAVSSNVETLRIDQSQSTNLYVNSVAVSCVLTRLSENAYKLTVKSTNAGHVSAWLRDLSDGYILFDEDVVRKLPGPISVRISASSESVVHAEGESIDQNKPYFISMPGNDENIKPLPEFVWLDDDNQDDLKRTPIYETHKKLGAKIIPFAGWEMPVWYTSVIDEHLAVRKTAGLFDVTHMGVFQVEGLNASVFLDSVVGNDIVALGIGESCYTHLLDPEADVLDDLLVYRRARNIFMMVVNAANERKDWTWLSAVKEGKVRISQERPWAKAFGREVKLRNLKDPIENGDMRVDIALQGPKSRDILLALDMDSTTRNRILGLKRTELCEATLGGFNLIVSRTGYTGERMAFELFVHPDHAEQFFNALLVVGEAFGIKPIGLGARDSLRTEAGLPLYGHEMGLGSGQMGIPDLGVGEAGFGSYVKTYKPWFIGREAYIKREAGRLYEVIRFRFNEKGVRVAHPGDPITDRRGKVIGFVTSCAIDQEGMLTGQALVDKKFAFEGTSLLIYQGAPDKVDKTPAELRLNDRTVIPNSATIVSRFP